MKRIILFCLPLVLVGCGGGGNGGNQLPGVNQAPTVQTSGAIRIDANASSTTSVTVDDDLTAASELIVEVTADNETLFPAGAVTVSDSDATRTITLVPAIDEVGTGLIGVNVTDDRGLSVVTQLRVDVDAITQNASTFGRDLAARDELDEPELINAIDFIDDVEDDDFADLLSP